MSESCGKSQLPMDINALLTFHETNLMVAMECYKFRAVGNTAVEHETNLQETIKEMYVTYICPYMHMLMHTYTYYIYIYTCMHIHMLYIGIKPMKL